MSDYVPDQTGVEVPDTPGTSPRASSQLFTPAHGSSYRGGSRRHQLEKSWLDVAVSQKNQAYLALAVVLDPVNMSTDQFVTSKWLTSNEPHGLVIQPLSACVPTVLADEINSSLKMTQTFRTACDRAQMPVNSSGGVRPNPWELRNEGASNMFARFFLRTGWGLGNETTGFHRQPTIGHGDSASYISRRSEAKTLAMLATVNAAHGTDDKGKIKKKMICHAPSAESLSTFHQTKSTCLYEQLLKSCALPTAIMAKVKEHKKVGSRDKWALVFDERIQLIRFVRLVPDEVAEDDEVDRVSQLWMARLDPPVGAVGAAAASSTPASKPKNIQDYACGIDSEVPDIIPFSVTWDRTGDGYDFLVLAIAFHKSSRVPLPKEHLRPDAGAYTFRMEADPWADHYPGVEYLPTFIVLQLRIEDMVTSAYDWSVCF
jgi:hypothetical protein